jgi:putative flavoprotein involved in K+ transport
LRTAVSSASAVPSVIHRVASASESIKSSIDGLITKKRISVPEEVRYRPVWTPPCERPELDYRVAGITSIVWCIGIRTDYSWIDLPVFNGRGRPRARGLAGDRRLFPRPAVALHVGLRALFPRGRDAEYLAEHIKARVGLGPADRQASLNEFAMGSRPGLRVWTGGYAWILCRR